MRVQVEKVSADYTGLVDLPTLKEFIRFDGTDQDTVLPVLVEQGIKLAEDWCNRSFGNKRYIAQFLGITPTDCSMRIPFGPIRDVISVKRIAADGTVTNLVENTDYYIIGLTSKRLIVTNFNYSVASPQYTYEIEYNAGPLDPSTTDAAVKGAIFKIISDSFENRENSITMTINNLPQDAMVSLANYRLK